jgi:hypothetical protein
MCHDHCLGIGCSWDLCGLVAKLCIFSGIPCIAHVGTENLTKTNLRTQT